MRTKTRQRKRKRTIAPLAAIAAVAALSAISLSGDQQRASSGAAGVTAHTRSAQGSTVVRDPETGALRDATPAELLELRGDSTQAASVPEPIVSATGFEGLRLGDDQATFTVATRRADGTVGIAHANGKRDAEHQVRTGSRGLVAGKEQVLER